MNDDEMRVAIGTACGWTLRFYLNEYKERKERWISPEGSNLRQADLAERTRERDEQERLKKVYQQTNSICQVKLGNARAERDQLKSDLADAKAYGAAKDAIASRYLAERDEAQDQLAQKILEEVKLKTALAAAEQARDAAEKLLRQHHAWHLAQTDRSPTHFGDTIGQINADEYADSEMYEKTEAYLHGQGAAQAPKEGQDPVAVRLITKLQSDLREALHKIRFDEDMDVTDRERITDAALALHGGDF